MAEQPPKTNCDDFRDAKEKANKAAAAYKDAALDSGHHVVIIIVISIALAVFGFMGEAIFENGENGGDGVPTAWILSWIVALGLTVVFFVLHKLHIMWSSKGTIDKFQEYRIAHDGFNENNENAPTAEELKAIGEQVKDYYASVPSLMRIPVPLLIFHALSGASLILALIIMGIRFI